ncbi:MAG: LysM peptidoglycan-binding domain-containing protein, partial [Oscillospiraceae bacterium]
MNKRPVSYLQTDSRWAKKPYRVPGENSTIGDSGCGPTAAAMLIETLTGKTYTPEDACAWSVAHGYKALKAGTYYAYFAPQFAEFGIKCWQLSWTNGYHNPKAKVHDQALEYLKQGYYLIALMKKGTWTGGGHFVVVWWADNKIRINDPASTRDKRLNGDPATFRNEAAYYWVVDARAYNNGGGASPAVPEYSTYTVKAGDSLSAIGAKTGVDWKTIAALNGISSPYTIPPGQVLKLAEKPKEAYN